ncbi:MAG: NADH-quinone oxidoreductase subunit L [Proteobacteria bacterium]|nr:NADH-quinone oxidoreductase subunit L [Pseudomonadota bacterium]
MTPEERNERGAAELERQQGFREGLHCCTAAGCLSCGADGLKRALVAEVEARGLAEQVSVEGTGCLGLCSRGPLVRRDSDGALFHELEPGEAGLLLQGDAAAEAALAARRIDTASHPFFAHQRRIVLENAGRVDPERLDTYLAVGGYGALAHAVSERSPQEVLLELRTSGLRGRGGAGYPTGVKWELVAKQPGTTKYVVCNADEGDPGAFMDRSVLEGDPHRVLEGMAIAGYAVGASHGFIYVRGEYALAIQRLQGAIRQAEREGLLGPRVLDSAFRFRVDLRIGAGAFVCGEETALIASIEGGRGEPRPRPPYPPEKGLWGQPTLINNVETFANVAPILREGGAWFAGIGTERSKGTKVFAVAGKTTHTGLVEVPMGTPLRTIVYAMAGGVADGGRVKAIQTGGPSGGFIPERLLDLPVDYESLVGAGSMMGSGGLIVMDEATSMLDVARYFMEFCRDESCGKCVPCRAGTVQMHELLERFCAGTANAQDLVLLKELATLLRETSLCGLGQTAPNPVLSVLRYFPEELERGLRRDTASPAADAATERA